MKRNTLYFIVVALLLGSLLAGCSTPATPTTTPPVVQTIVSEPTKPVEPTQAPKPLTIAILTNGPVATTGWSYMLADAGKQFEKAFGNRVNVRIAENIPYGQETARTIEQLISEGANVIIEGVYAVEFVDPIIKAHPEVKFIVFGTTLTAPNVQVVWWNQGEYQYLLGMAAGLLTKTNKIGYISPWDNPMMRTEFVGFQMGARSVNPNLTTSVVSLNSWYDPAGARQAVEAFANSGIDVVGGDMDDTGKVVASEEAGVWVMGAYSNMQKASAPNWYVNTYVYDFGKMFTPIIQSIFDNTWVGNSELVWYEIGNGVDIGEWGDKVPKDIVDKVMAVRATMVDKEFNPFTGPIEDKLGNTVLAADKIWTPQEWISGFTWSLPGIEGIPDTLK